ncbi:hypothetical protein ACFVIM_32610 [Streptomyces sp. NPDC057638]|uniref:hypothetical protein n=1 Tax=Streptomyces sp. NPDC057638 TaxID=3346190 RepID=UPI0036840BB2
MPLPFLTADRTFETDDVALPFADHDLWRRPYRPGPWRVGAGAVTLLLASFVMIAAMVIAVAGALSGAAVCLAVGGGLIVFALRVLRIGTWVSRHGVRRVGLLSTSTVQWSRVSEVRTAQQPVRYLGLPRTVQGQALLLIREGGGEPLPLLTDHSADFLGRVEAFDRAADTVEAWASEYRA